MNIFPMAITLLIGFMLFVVITNLLSKSRRDGSGTGGTGSFYQPPYDGMPQDPFFNFPGEHETFHQSSHAAPDSGDWGGRNMSFDHHDAGNSGDTGGG